LAQVVGESGGVLARGRGPVRGDGLQLLGPLAAVLGLLGDLVDDLVDLDRSGLGGLVGAHAPVIDLVVLLEHHSSCAMDYTPHPAPDPLAAKPTAPDRTTTSTCRTGRLRWPTMKAILHTNHGDITLALFSNLSLKSVDNFAGLATGEKEYTDDAGRSNPTPFYDGLGYHRIISGSMIQGGCPLGEGVGGPGYTFDDEIHPDLSFSKPYLLAMANAGKQMGKGTNGSQFFISVGETPWLNGKHTIFGEVADGPSREVVDAIAAVPTGAMDKPVEPVTIDSVEIIRD